MDIIIFESWDTRGFTSHCLHACPQFSSVEKCRLSFALPNSMLSLRSEYLPQVVALTIQLNGGVGDFFSLFL